MIDLVFITFNRLDYTRRSLASVLQDPSEEFRLFLWDNGSTDGTREYLQGIQDPRIQDVMLRDKNEGQVQAVNTVWGQSDAEFLGKLDNDCLVTPGWTRTIAEAHRDIPELGVCACWHFFEDDFDEARAKKKIQTFGKHRILRHPWTCGTGLLLKNETYRKLGPMEGRATTQYWMRMAEAGYVNGFYYPLILQDHMDDLKSPYSELKNEEAFQKVRKTTMFVRPGIDTRRDLWRWRDQLVSNLLDDSFDPKYYSGFRGRLWRLRNRLGMKFGTWFDTEPNGFIADMGEVESRVQALPPIEVSGVTEETKVRTPSRSSRH